MRIVTCTIALSIAMALLSGSAQSDDSPGGRRVVGGVRTTIQQHPWQVALNIKGPGGVIYLCGGSLINQRWILTAAHCFPTTNAGDTRVKAGETNYTLSGNGLEIERVVPHPSYNSNTHENDFALIKLKNPYRGTSITLAGSATALTNSRLEVAGWGATSEGGSASRELMLATVPYVENATCNEPASYNGRIKPTMLCAGEKEGGVDACQGDSGGPLVLRGTDGAVLVGDGCAKKLKYGIYTRVAAYRDWINKVVVGTPR